MYEPVYIERFIIDEEVALERVAHCQLGVLRFSYAKLSATLMLNHATAVGMPRQQQTVAYGQHVGSDRVSQKQLALLLRLVSYRLLEGSIIPLTGKARQHVKGKHSWPCVLYQFSCNENRAV